MTLKAEVDRFNSIVKCPEDREMMVNLTLMSNESPSPAFVNLVKVNDILQCVNPEGQHRYKVIGVREQEVKGFEEVFVEKLEVTPEIPGGQEQTWNPANSLYHGTYDVENIPNIIIEGLRPGSSVSTWKGQATSYPIILEYDRLAVEQVSYRPEDFRLLEKGDRPKAIYVDVAEFGEGVRDIDEVNRELANILERLEDQGIATPERVGELIGDGDYKTLGELDARLPHLAKEMDAFTSRGPSPSGEDILERVVVRAGGLPVYRVTRDGEGEIDWHSRQK